MAAYETFPPAARALALLAGLLLAGCSSNSLGSGNFISSLSGQPAAAPAPAPPPSPPADMAGRWRFVSTNGEACGMTFTAPVGAAQGAVAPEGGCPGNFFTSRHWVFEQGSLALLDHNRKPLVQLKQSPVGRFEGETANREFVWLER